MEAERTHESPSRPPAPPAAASTSAGLAVLGAAGALGAAGDALLRVGPPGVNGTLWLAAFLAALALLRRRLTPGAGAVETAAGALGLAFALGLAWRDSPVVKLLDLAVVGTAVALSFLRPLGARAGRVSASKLAAAGALAGLHAAFGMPVLVVSDVRWGEVRRRPQTARVLAVARGAAIAAPLLALFGALLAAADAVFAHVLADVLGIDVLSLASHLLLACLFAWVAGGVLRGALLARPVAPFWDDLPRPPRLGVLEIGVVLGLLDALFLGFVVVQVRTLFGGAGYLVSLPGLTYAQYARSGFFQLVAVVAAAVPLLLACGWLLRRDAPGDEKAYRALAAVMVILLAVMLVSALRRMRLYTDEFGLSELRVYTQAFMAWLAAVLAAFAATVLRGRRERFAPAAVAAWIAVVAALNVLDPDARIARTNLERAAASGRFDAAYVASLSADAVPALASGLAALSPPQRTATVAALARRWRGLSDADWRTWSVGRAGARRALERGPQELRRAAADAAAGPGRGER